MDRLRLVVILRCTLNVIQFENVFDDWLRFRLWVHKLPHLFHHDEFESLLQVFGVFLFDLKVVFVTTFIAVITFTSYEVLAHGWIGNYGRVHMNELAGITFVAFALEME